MTKTNKPGYVVKSAHFDAWSGPEIMDPSLGRNVVYEREEAYVFTNRHEAKAEALNYRGGAKVLRVRTPPSLTQLSLAMVAMMKQNPSLGKWRYRHEDGTTVTVELAGQRRRRTNRNGGQS